MIKKININKIPNDLAKYKGKLLELNNILKNTYIPLLNTNRLILSGSFCRSFIFNMNDHNDIDLYFDDFIIYSLMLNRLRNINNLILLETTNRSIVTYKDNKIDLILDNSLRIENTIGKFDITICQFQMGINSFCYSGSFFEDNENKVIRLGEPNRVSHKNIMDRIEKYKKRGYTITDEELKKTQKTKSKISMIYDNFIVNANTRDESIWANPMPRSVEATWNIETFNP